MPITVNYIQKTDTRSFFVRLCTKVFWTNDVTTNWLKANMLRPFSTLDVSTSCSPKFFLLATPFFAHE